MSNLYLLHMLGEIPASRSELKPLAGAYSLWTESLKQVFRLKWRYAHSLESVSDFGTSYIGGLLRQELQTAMTTAYSALMNEAECF